MAGDGERRTGSVGARRGAVVLLLALLVGACTADRAASPTEDLDAAAAGYVIPGSDTWGGSDPCVDGAACAPPTTPADVARAEWFRVEDLDLVADEGAGNPVVIDVLAEPVGATSARPAVDSTETLSLQLWSGIELEHVVTPMEDGHEVWVQLCDSSPASLPWACAFVAFDDAERFAAIGTGTADWFTVPMARAAADARADTGRAYLLGLITED